MARHEVQGVDQLGEGEAMAVELQGKPIAICRVEGELHAIGNVCTHEHALLSEGYIEGGYIECPLHQGRFDLKTGAPLCPPVTEPVPVYPVQREGDKVYVEVKE